MKVQTYKPIINAGHLKQTNRDIVIEHGRWIDWQNISHPMVSKRIDSFYGRRVYFLHRFGHDSGSHHFGVHIQLSYWQNQKFLWIQKAHWFQQPENLKWILNRIIPAGFFFTIIKYLSS